MTASSFLQSPEWEEFQRSLGRRTWRIDGALVIRHDLPLGLDYLYCPRPDAGIKNFTPTPKFGVGAGESRIKIIEEIRKIATEEESIFLKIDPTQQFQVPIPDLIGDKFQVPTAPALQPRETIILDLEKSEEELLAAMHEKTRYNIRLAERKGVQVRSSEFGVRSSELFWGLLRDTAERDGFSTHPREYYEKLLATRSDNFSNELFFAEYRGEILAAALVNFYHPSSKLQAPSSKLHTATYLHGASSREYKEAMAPHLLHWRIIQEAKCRGFRYYDLWGIDERRWPGLTRFKTGFGGAKLIYPPSVDIVYRPGWYGIYSLWKRLRPR